MNTQERAARTTVESTQWADFLYAFTNRNETRATTLEIYDDQGDQEQQRGLPLVGVDLDTHSTHGPSLTIMLGEDSTEGDQDRHLTHTITGVQALLFQRNIDDQDQALHIESKDGTTTVLTFI
ncbi:DUF5335 family protein [Candidatus Cyanaurora vandensis]|uniref:DUF5335 family protein n=1 Tax=Candidatus Cyanaurora vandensis TaxID=2714958 RepID=UPI00257D346A|nr:DUF5335 family protein [Candidatus Cyanaurora vandensis]